MKPAIYKAYMKFNSPMDLLDKATFPGISLEEILQQDQFLRQYQEGQNRCTSFMKYDKCKSLIKYLTTLQDCDNKKKAYKFPYLASEILIVNNPTVLQFFLAQSNFDIQIKTYEQIQVPIKSEETKLEDEDQKKLKEKTQNDINQGEGKPATKRVRREKKIQKSVQPLLNDLFAYFEGDLDFTLAGYVSKVMLHFITKKPTFMLHYFLEDNRIDKLLDHIESISVGQVMSKIITLQVNEKIEERHEIMKKVVQKLSEKSEKCKMNNIGYCICETINKLSANAKGNNYLPEMIERILSAEIIRMIMKNIMSNEKIVSMFNAAVLYHYLVQSPIHHEFIDQQELLGQFFRKCISILSQKESTLGIGRIKILQTISYLLKENIFDSRYLLSKQSQFMFTLVNLVRWYPFNNILHNQFTKILDICFGFENQNPMLLSILQDDILLNFIIDEVEQAKKAKRKSERKGYFGHIVKICMKIDDSTNESLELIKERFDFREAMECLIQKEKIDLKKSLGGFEKKREGVEKRKLSASFYKQQILKDNVKFLKQSPPAVFKNEENINIKHPDMQMIIEKQVGIGILSVSQALCLEEVMMEQQDVYDPKYWKQYLCSYNVDQLINDL